MGGAGAEGGFWFWGSIGLVVAGNVAYHIGLKSVPREVHPLAPLVVLFATAAATALLAWPRVARGLSLKSELSRLNWMPVLVGVGIVAIELGFLVAYRLGWKLSTASLSANLVLSCVLVAIGVLAYREALTPSRMGGLALCLAGLWLLNRD
jgi:multidrug transporter EmrE-like cation transporter